MAGGSRGTIWIVSILCEIQQIGDAVCGMSRNFSDRRSSQWAADFGEQLPEERFYFSPVPLRRELPGKLGGHSAMFAAQVAVSGIPKEAFSNCIRVHDRNSPRLIRHRQPAILGNDHWQAARHSFHGHETKRVSQ